MMKKITAVLVAATLILAATVAALAYTLHTREAEYTSSLSAAQADIDGMSRTIEVLSQKVPVEGEDGDVFYFDKTAKVYYNTDAAVGGYDSIGSLDKFLPELAEKGVLKFYNTELIGVSYLMRSTNTTPQDGETVTVYAIAGGYFVVNPTTVG